MLQDLGVQQYTLRLEQRGVEAARKMARVAYQQKVKLFADLRIRERAAVAEVNRKRWTAAANGAVPTRSGEERR